MVHRSNTAVWFSSSDAPESRLLKVKEELNILPKNFPICRELMLSEISRLQHEITVTVQNVVFAPSFQTEADGSAAAYEDVSKSSWVMSEPFIGYDDNSMFQNIPESRYTFTSVTNISVESWTQDDSFQMSAPIDGVNVIGEFHPESKLPEATTKDSLKIFVPVKEYPGYNFIGRLIGPRGATMKEMQKESRCRIYIRGKGSLKFKDASQEHAKASLPGNEHLNEDLHVLIEFDGPRVEKERCMQSAETMVRELLVPPARDEQDDLKKQQLRDLAILNGTFKENKTLQPCSNRRVTGPKPGAARGKGGRGRVASDASSDTRTSTPDVRPPSLSLPLSATVNREIGPGPGPLLETTVAAGPHVYEGDRSDGLAPFATPFTPPGEVVCPLSDSDSAGASGPAAPAAAAWSATPRSLSLIVPRVAGGDNDDGGVDLAQMGWSERGGLGRARVRSPSLPMMPWIASDADNPADLTATAAGRARWHPYARSTQPDASGHDDGCATNPTGPDAAAAGVYLLF